MKKYLVTVIRRPDPEVLRYTCVTARNAQSARNKTRKLFGSTVYYGGGWCSFDDVFQIVNVTELTDTKKAVKELEQQLAQTVREMQNARELLKQAERRYFDLRSQRDAISDISNPA